VAESEANDDAASADAVAGVSDKFSFCGKIASGTDVDFFKFTSPADAAMISSNYGTSSVAAFKAEGTADGATFALTSPVLKKGKEYVIKVSSNNATAYDYRITVTFTK